MSRRLVWGAGVALCAAAVVAGCSKKSKSGAPISVSTGVDVSQGTKDFTQPANLATDGNAFSSNGQDFTTLKCAYNNESPVTSSSSGNSGADKSAMVCFTTLDTSSVNGPFVRLWASHWDGSSWTPPVELKGEDRDETKAVTVANIVMIPLNTDQYKGSNGQVLSSVASNKGNWVILWDSTTAKQTPVNLDPLNGPVQAVPATGPHRTVYYTLFVKALRSKSSATSQVLGAGGAASGTLTTPSRSYEYGFLKTALEIPTFRGGESALNTGVGANGKADQPFGETFGQRTRFSRPAEDVIGYGAVSDTFRKCVKYTSGGGGGGNSGAFTNGIGFAGEPVPVIPGANGAGLFNANQLGPNSRTRTFQGINNVGGAPTFNAVAGVTTTNLQVGQNVVTLNTTAGLAVNDVIQFAGDTSNPKKQFTITNVNAGANQITLDRNYDGTGLANANPTVADYPTALLAAATNPGVFQINTAAQVAGSIPQAGDRVQFDNDVGAFYRVTQTSAAAATTLLIVGTDEGTVKYNGLPLQKALTAATKIQKVTAGAQTASAVNKQSVTGGNPTPQFSALTSGTAGPSGATYSLGDATTFIRLFYTQIASSRAGSTYTRGPAGNGARNQNGGITSGSEQGGQRYVGFSVGFDLAKLTWGTPAELTYPARRDTTRPWAVQPLPSFLAYNQHAFIRYLDASLSGEENDGQLINGNASVNKGSQLDVSDGNPAGGVTGDSGTTVNASNPGGATLTQALAVFTVNNAGDGTNSLSANTFDVTLLGTAGKHNTTVPTAATTFGFNIGGLVNKLNSRGHDEAVDFVNDAFCCDAESCPIFGADEGLADTVAFLRQHSNTLSSTLANATTEEVRLISVGIKSDGTLQQGTNPKIMSTHGSLTAGAGVGGGGNNTDVNANTEYNNYGNGAGINGASGKSQALRQAVSDSVIDYDCRMSRDGKYILVGFRQLNGSTMGAQVVLKAIAYKTSRQGDAASNFDTRFSGEVTLNTTQTISVRGDITRTSTASVGEPVEMGGARAGARVFFTPSFMGNFVQTRNPDYSFLATGQMDAATVGNTATIPTLSAPASPVLGGGQLADFNTLGTTPVTLNAVPVKCWEFQGGLGYACGFQSNVNVMSMIWVTSDGTEDRVFIEQLTVSVTGTATLTKGSETELEAGQSVSGRGIADPVQANTPQDLGYTRQVIKSSFRWLPRSVNLCSDFWSVDGGADSAGKGGAVLVTYLKIVDGTTTDGDFYDRQIIGVLFDGSSVTNRVILSRNLDENNATPGAGGVDATSGAFMVVNRGANDNAGISTPANGAGNVTGNVGIGQGPLTGSYRTTFNGVACVLTPLPTNSDFINKPSFGADVVEMLFMAPSGDNNKTARALWSRGWDLTVKRTSSTASTAFGDQWVPAAAATTTDAKFKEPQRVDLQIGADVVAVNACFHKSKEMTIIFTQDDHLWVSVNSDIKKGWSQNNDGLPAPTLLDDNSSSDAAFFTSCTRVDKDCNDSSGSHVFYQKRDLSGSPATGTTAGAANVGDLRLFVRTRN